MVNNKSVTWKDCVIFYSVVSVYYICSEREMGDTPQFRGPFSCGTLPGASGSALFSAELCCLL